MVVVLAVLLASQSWIILYVVNSWSSNYTPAGHFTYKDVQGQVCMTSVNFFGNWNEGTILNFALFAAITFISNIY